MTIHRITSIKLAGEDRIIAAAEDKCSIESALKDVEPLKRGEARETLLAGKTVAIGVAIGGLHIKIRLVPTHAPNRSALKKEKV